MTKTQDPGKVSALRCAECDKPLRYRAKRKTLLCSACYGAVRPCDNKPQFYKNGKHKN